MLRAAGAKGGETLHEVVPRAAGKKADDEALERRQPHVHVGGAIGDRRLARRHGGTPQRGATSLLRDPICFDEEVAALKKHFRVHADRMLLRTETAAVDEVPELAAAHAKRAEVLDVAHKVCYRMSALRVGEFCTAAEGKVELAVREIGYPTSRPIASQVQRFPHSLVRQVSRELLARTTQSADDTFIRATQNVPDEIFRK